jgi:hypothetical protein
MWRNLIVTGLYRSTPHTQYARRNYEGSIESFEACEAHGGTDIACWYLRGLAYFWLARCDEAWEYLMTSKQIAAEQNTPDSIVTQIDIGLENITRLCVGYSDQPTPSPIPPTIIPPTPIGGFGG